MENYVEYNSLETLFSAITEDMTYYKFTEEEISSTLSILNSYYTNQDMSEITVPNFIKFVDIINKGAIYIKSKFYDLYVFKKEDIYQLGRYKYIDNSSISTSLIR